MPQQLTTPRPRLLPVKNSRPQSSCADQRPWIAISARIEALGVDFGASRNCPHCAPRSDTVILPREVERRSHLRGQPTYPSRGQPLRRPIPPASCRSTARLSRLG